MAPATGSWTDEAIHNSCLYLARIVADHLEIRHPAVLEAALAFDDPGLAEILHHVRVTNR